ncbi:MAG: hypothetical protein U9Q61_10535 [Thermodesulfobacteriota bacterium]|nr:hypothetical protein [Thermodesulfobacteriota bacterium]
MYLTADQNVTQNRESDMQRMVLPSLLQEKLPRGRVLYRSLAKDPGQFYYLYLPQAEYSRTSLFVSIHGVKRMAKEHADAFATFAERYGVVLVAPVFPADRFPDYQRLGVNKKSLRADHALHDIFEEVSMLTAINTDQLFMFGYSGGGQFVHRYAMAYPEKVKRIVVAAPGWYTFPDQERKYPYGIAKTRKISGHGFDPARFLTIPSCVVVGENDTHRDNELRKGNKIDRQQGENRLERGKSWIRVMKKCAETYHLDTEFNFQVLPDSGHSFLKCMDRGGMGKLVFEFLFGGR